MRVRSSKCIQIMPHYIIYIPIIPKHISLKSMMFHNDLHVVPCRAPPRHQIWQQLVTQERLSQGRAHPPLRSAAVDLEADIPSQPSRDGTPTKALLGTWKPLEHLGTPWNALERLGTPWNALEAQNLQTAELCWGDRTPQQRRYQGLHLPNHRRVTLMVELTVTVSWKIEALCRDGSNGAELDRPSGSPGSPNPKGYLWTQPELRWAPDLRTDNMNHLRIN